MGAGSRGGGGGGGGARGSLINICDNMNSIESIKVQLIHISLTSPVTSATAEQTFSARHAQVPFLFDAPMLHRLTRYT